MMKEITEPTMTEVTGVSAESSTERNTMASSRSKLPRDVGSKSESDLNLKKDSSRTEAKEIVPETSLVPIEFRRLNGEVIDFSSIHKRWLSIFEEKPMVWRTMRSSIDEIIVPTKGDYMDQKTTLWQLAVYYISPALNMPALTIDFVLEDTVLPHSLTLAEVGEMIGASNDTDVESETTSGGLQNLPSITVIINTSFLDRFSYNLQSDGSYQMDTGGKATVSLSSHANQESPGSAIANRQNTEPTQRGGVAAAVEDVTTQVETFGITDPNTPKPTEVEIARDLPSIFIDKLLGIREIVVRSFRNKDTFGSTLLLPWKKMYPGVLLKVLEREFLGKLLLLFKHLDGEEAHFLVEADEIGKRMSLRPPAAASATKITTENASTTVESNPEDVSMHSRLYDMHPIRLKSLLTEFLNYCVSSDDYCAVRLLLDREIFSIDEVGETVSINGEPEKEEHYSDAIRIRSVMEKVVRSISSGSYYNASHPLIQVSHTGNANMLKLLVEARIPVNSKPKTFSALHAACTQGWANILQYMIDQPHTDVNVRDFSDQTCLHSACCQGHESCVQVLLNYRGKKAESVGSNITESKSVQSKSTESKNIDSKSRTVGMETNAKVIGTNVKAVDNTFDNAMQTTDGRTQSPSYDPSDEINAIIQNRDDVEQLLHDAKDLFGNANELGGEHVRQFEKDQRGSRSRKGETERTQNAEKHAASECIGDERRIDINALDNTGCTAFHQAVGLCRVAIVRMMLDQQDSSGLDINVYGKTNCTPLDLIQMRDRRDIVDLLREHGARTYIELTEKQIENEVQSETTD